MSKLNDFKLFIANHKRTLRLTSKVKQPADEVIVHRNTANPSSERPPKHLPYHAVLQPKLTPPHPLLRSM
jgi:hypothetical protein